MAKNKSHKHLFTFKKNTAFTLAEVLITLGIIGIVAALTIPNLIAQQQKRTTVTKLQRAMSVLNQAYRRAYDDVGEATADEAKAMGSEEYFNKYWAPYLKIAHICRSYSACGYDTLTPYYNLSGGQTELWLIANNVRVAVKTLDGAVYLILVSVYSATEKIQKKNSQIYVDINGGSKPNKYGKDVFIFERVIDGEKGGVVLPLGYDKTDSEINDSCKKNGYGVYCAEKIRRAGWQIDKSYPW